MSIRQGWPTLAAVVLSGSAAIAQSSAQAPAPTSSRSSDSAEKPVTVVGCLQREADYRKAHDRGRGGAAGTGVGSGDEYVLINASLASSAPGALDCSSTSSAEAYELTGSREHDLKELVGRAVQITGIMKKAAVKPVGTSGNTQPTGGFDPLGQDLKLFEIDVTAFQAVGTLAQATPRTPVPAADARPAAPPARPAEPVATQAPATTPAAAEALPHTASPLPLASLIGLLSLGGAAGLRLLRRV